MKYLLESLTEEETRQLIEYLIEEIAIDRIYFEGVLHGIFLTLSIITIIMLIKELLKTKKEKRKGE